jgi:hypothetical protein
MTGGGGHVVDGPQRVRKMVETTDAPNELGRRRYTTYGHVAFLG